MIKAGFTIPSREEVQQFADTLPKPKGYPKSTINISQSIAEMTNFCQWEVAVQLTPWAKMARGLCRNHRRGAGANATHVLSVDLTGPHPMAMGTRYIYALVAVYYIGIEGSLPFVQGLTTKTAPEVASAMLTVMKEILWLCGNIIIIRIHSDAGGEFWNEIANNMTNRLGIMQTKTEGYDPKANGRAESYVGLLKHKATEELLKNHLPINFWYWGMRQHAYLYRAKKTSITLTTKRA